MYFMPAVVIPEFPGGMAALREYISKNLCYPEGAIKNGIQGAGNTQFLSEKEWKISDIEVFDGLYPDLNLNKEAVRIIQTNARVDSWESP